MLLAVVVVCAIVAVVGLVGLVVVVVPFVVTMDLAERRGFSPVRWGAASLAGTALMAGTIIWLWNAEHPPLLARPALVLGVLPLIVVALLAPGPRRWVGWPGAHQR